jgi:hypothetical protein
MSSLLLGYSGGASEQASAQGVSDGTQGREKEEDRRVVLPQTADHNVGEGRDYK